MKQLWYTFLITTSVVLLFNNCANVKPPTGGDKDTTAPKLVLNACYPKPSQKVNFHDNYIELIFDEYVEENNLFNELSITPSLKGTYKTDTYKRRVKIEFTEALDSNTTYTLNFGSGIVDVTERNPAENLQFSFSTGSVMDSLRIGGKVVHNLTNKAAENVRVCLYFANDTITPTNGKPLYYVTTDDLGVFQFDHLKADKYILVAIKDGNNDLKYQPNIDKVALYKDTINLTENVNGLDLRLFAEDKLKPRVTFVKGKKQYTEVEFNKSIFEATIKTTPEVHYAFKEKSDKIRFINTLPPVVDSVKIELSLIDSSNYTLDTTLTVLFKEPKKRLNYDLKYNTIYDQNGYTTDTLSFDYVFNKPIVKFNADSVFIVTTDTININQDPQTSYTWNTHRNTLQVLRKNNTNPVTQFIFNKATFITCEKDTIDRKSLSFNKLDTENAAVLEGKIITKEKRFFLQLLDEKKNILEVVDSKSSFSFPHLQAGKYSFRVLIDENNDGIYQTGDFEEKQLPERIYFFPQEIKLKDNWEITDVEIKF